MFEINDYSREFDKKFLNYVAGDIEIEYLEGLLLKDAERFTNIVNRNLNHLRNSEDVDFDSRWAEIQQAHIFICMIKNCLIELKKNNNITLRAKGTKLQ